MTANVSHLLTAVDAAAAMKEPWGFEGEEKLRGRGQWGAGRHLC